MDKKIWFTSDTHFSHIKDFLWSPRGFNSIEEHDEMVIKNWNELVAPEDEVYHLGDVMLNDNEHGLKCINRLNGKIHLIIGNHDRGTRIELYKQCPNIVSVDYAQEIKYKKHYFYLSHYPTITANYDDEKPWANHLINLHGHTHSKEKFYNNNPYMYCVCLDAHNNRPVSIDEILLDIKTKVNEVKKEKE